MELNIKDFVFICSFGKIIARINAFVKGGQVAYVKKSNMLKQGIKNII